MNTLDAWRNRPLTVRTLLHCEKCKQLCEDVAQRSNYWPRVTATTCQSCFKKLITEAQGVAC
jgi:hypothetical protein